MSESKLVKIPHYWKLHVTAQIQLGVDGLRTLIFVCFHYFRFLEGNTVSVLRYKMQTQTHVLLSLLVLVHLSSADDAPSVQTEIGTVIGSVVQLNVFDNPMKVERYLGIPYAEPPVGELRFRKSVRKQHLESPFLAKKHGDTCLQIMTQFVLGPTTSEDCLYLNLYVPALRKGQLAVMVFIHGGGFMFGASNAFISDTLAAYGDVIVVTFNYRMLVWGFLSTGDEHAPGNYGLWDQHLAIKWVHDNIKAFGGDPSRITVIGESAGGVSAVYQGLFEKNDGLFQRIIPISGSINSALFPNPKNPKMAAEKLGKIVGCENMDSEPLLQCLREKPADIINAAVNDFNNGFLIAPMPFIPRIDGEFVKDASEDILTGNTRNSGPATDFFSTLDFMGGIDAEEGIAFLGMIAGVFDLEHFEPSRNVFEDQIIPIALSYALGTDVPEVVKLLVAHEYTNWDDPEDMGERRHETAAIITDIFFSLSMIETLKLHESVTNYLKGSYMFVFDIEPTRHLVPGPSWSKRAVHADELLYLFYGETNEIAKSMSGKPFEPADWEVEIAKYIMNLTSNFAKTG